MNIAAASSPRAHRPSLGELRTNTGISLALVTFLALVPIPAASNRPVFWALSALIVALLGVVFALGLVRRKGNPHFSLRRIPIVTALASLVIAFLAIQLLPLSSLFEGEVLDQLWGPIVSPAISLSPGATLLTLMQFLTNALFFYLMVQVSVSRERAYWLAPTLFYVISAHAAYALIALTQLGDPMLIVEKWAYQGVATGTFVNRNSFATFAAFGLVLGLALVFRDVETFVRSRSGTPQVGASLSGSVMLINMVCVLTLTAALLATQSRLGSFAAAAGCLAVSLVFLARGRITSRLSMILGISVLVPAAIAAATLYGAGLFERIGSVEAATNVRTELYLQVAGMITERPWLGYGGGTFEVVFPYFHRLPVSADLLWDKAHSTYLTLWAELGLVAGSAVVLIVAGLGWRLFRGALKRDRDWAMPLAGFGVIMVAAVHSVGDFSLEIQANALMFLAIIALGLAGVAGPSKSSQPRE